VRRHETDVTSLVFGLIFLGVAATWALVQGDLISLPAATVLGPAILVTAGLVGLLGTLRGLRRSQQEPRPTPEPASTEPPSTEPPFG
jgi:hypothetical protein